MTTELLNEALPVFKVLPMSGRSLNLPSFQCQISTQERTQQYSVHKGKISYILKAISTIRDMSILSHLYKNLSKS